MNVEEKFSRFAGRRPLSGLREIRGTRVLFYICALLIGLAAAVEILFVAMILVRML